MSTQNQDEANRLNAEKRGPFGRGPRTGEGEARSAVNRRTLIPGEDAEELQALRTELIDEFDPATPCEELLVERMAHNEWLTRRALRLQAQAFTDQADQPGLPKDLGLLIRYQSTAARALDRKSTR